MIDFSIPEDVEQQRKALAETLAENVAPSAIDRDRDRHFESAMWQELADAGYLGACLPTSVGGQGLSGENYAVLQAELAAADPGLFLAADTVQAVAGNVLSEAGGDVATGILRAIAGGEAVVGFAVTEAAAGTDRGAVATTAEAGGDGLVLNGEKQFVLLAEQATGFVVYAKTGGEGFDFVYVPADAPGLSTESGPVYAGFRSAPMGTVKLDGVTVPAENRLGSEGSGPALLERAETRWQLVAAAAALGLVEAAFNQARDYAMEREQFGKKIAHFQEVHFPIADVRVVADGIRRTLVKAAWAFDQRTDDHRELAAMVKNFAAHGAPGAIDKAAQVCGARAQTEGHYLEMALRCSRSFGLIGGTSERLEDLLAVKTLNRYR